MRVLSSSWARSLTGIRTSPRRRSRWPPSNVASLLGLDDHRLQRRPDAPSIHGSRTPRSRTPSSARRPPPAPALPRESIRLLRPAVVAERVARARRAAQERLNSAAGRATGGSASRRAGAGMSRRRPRRAGVTNACRKPSGRSPCREDHAPAVRSTVQALEVRGAAGERAGERPSSENDRTPCRRDRPRNGGRAGAAQAVQLEHGRADGAHRSASIESGLSRARGGDP